MTISPDPARPSRRALVVGTGLIGSSLGLALRARGWHVSGWDRDPERARAAEAAGALDRVGDDPEAEIAFIATPASSAAASATALLGGGSSPETGPPAGGRTARRLDLVVTDVSGVKAPVVGAIDHPRFVGGHPMAGSEQVGPEGADADLFTGAAWVLTPTATTDLSAFSRLRDAVASLGADVVVLSPEDHDRLVAVVSHVPHLVAATLMNAAADGAEQDSVLLRLAAGGFRDMTRVAAGHPGIWPDVCADNADAIVGTLDRVIGDLSAMRDRVAVSDRSGLLEVLGRASAARQGLPARGARPHRAAVVRVPVPNREGVLAEITSAAGDLGVNIYDIEIAHSSEGPRGVLHLVVDEDDASKLCDAVAGRGYRSTCQRLT